MCRSRPRKRLLLEKADADFARDLTPDQIKPLAGNPDIKVESFKAANTFYMGPEPGLRAAGQLPRCARR